MEMDITNWNIVAATDVNNLPWRTGLYAFCINDRVLYLGKSKNLATRVGYGRHPTFKLLQRFWGVLKIHYLVCPMYHEKELIEKYRPTFNTIYKSRKQIRR